MQRRQYVNDHHDTESCLACVLDTAARTIRSGATAKDKTRGRNARDIATKDIVRRRSGFQCMVLILWHLVTNRLRFATDLKDKEGNCQLISWAIFVTTLACCCINASLNLEPS